MRCSLIHHKLVLTMNTESEQWTVKVYQTKDQTSYISIICQLYICEGYADHDDEPAQAFTAAWGPGAAGGPRPAGQGWRLLPLHRCGGSPRGSGSCGGHCSRRRSSTASWPQSCCCEPCCRNPCMCRTSSRCLEVIARPGVTCTLRLIA